MSYKAFKIARILIAAFIAAIISISITIENAYLAITAVVVGTAAMLLVKRNVKALLVDEMVKTISGKSALVAYTVSVIALAATSLSLVFANLSNRESQAYNLGIALSYAVMIEMLIYSAAYYFYNKKYGRDDE